MEALAVKFSCNLRDEISSVLYIMMSDIYCQETIKTIKTILRNLLVYTEIYTLWHPTTGNLFMMPPRMKM